MQTNRTKRKLEAGKLVFGSFISIPSPDVAEVLGRCGLDFVIIDCEHRAIDYQTTENIIRACEIADITPIVRVTRNDRQEIVRYLDSGALGVHIPLVPDKAAAEAAVRAAKYYPEGKRGMYYGRSAGYSASEQERAQYLLDSNRETIVVCAIESEEALRNLPEMLAVDGIDVFFVGPADLSQDIGYPGQFRHPAVLEAIDGAIAEIVAAGRIAGYIALDMEGYVTKGVRFITAVDTGLLRAGATQFVNRAFNIVK